MKFKTKILLLILFASIGTIQAQVYQEINKILPTSYYNSPGSNYSSDLCIDGDYAVIGVDGYLNDTGCAYVLYYNLGTWETVAMLTASDGIEGDDFGIDVSISGNNIVIGTNDNNNKQGAAYVFVKPTVGWSDATETAKLTASDGEINDRFGSSVDIFGDVIVIGAKGDDDNGSMSGSAYIYVKPSEGWVSFSESAKLTASDGIAQDYFGNSISISGDYIVVGAYGVDIKGNMSGLAYVFEKPIGGWKTATENATLTASDGAADDYFGISVSISENTIVIGALGDNNDNGDERGSVYVFEKTGANWVTTTETAKLIESENNFEKWGDFGIAVSISGDYIVVGARYDYHNGSNGGAGAVYVFKKPINGWSNITEIAKLTSTILGGNLGSSVSISGDNIIAGALKSDFHGEYSGAMYAFTKPPEGWISTTEDQILTPILLSNIGDEYGFSVAIDGDYAVVGSRAYSYTKYIGCAYILYNNKGSWETVAMLTASDGTEYDYFGTSVSISGNHIVVGAKMDNEKGENSGSAYVFEKPVDGWITTTETAKLTASDGAIDDYFGSSVSVSGDNIVIGAFAHDDANDVNKYAIGAAYVFVKPNDGWLTATETAKLTTSDAAQSDYFGCSVGISNNFVIVGAYGDDNVGVNNGAAYIFEKPIGGWTETTEIAKFTASDPAITKFGKSVSIFENNIVIGSSKTAHVFTKPLNGWTTATETGTLSASDASLPYGYSSSVAVSDKCIIVGTQEEYSSSGVGSAYVFIEPENGWITSSETMKLTASDGLYGDHFGYSVGISGNYIIVGASLDDQNDLEKEEDSGSAYFFKGPNPVITNQPTNLNNICLDQTAEFIVEADYIDNFQWQVSTDNGQTWSVLNDDETYTGTSTKTLSISTTILLNGNKYSCIVSNTNESQRSDICLLNFDTSKPLITCAENQTVTANGINYYSVTGSEFDPIFISDNCNVASVINDYNNLASLANAEIPLGTNVIVWTVTDNIGNSETCSFEIVVNENTTIVEKITQNGISIYPNPVSNNLNININKNKIHRITISSITGNKLFEKTNVIKDEIIDFSNFNTGIYIINIQSENAVFIEKVIKEY